MKISMSLILTILINLARSDPDTNYGIRHILRRGSVANGDYLVNRVNGYVPENSQDIRVQATISVYDLLPHQSFRPASKASSWVPMATARKDDSVDETELTDVDEDQGPNNEEGVPEVPPPDPYIIPIYRTSPPQHMTGIESRLHRQIAKVQTKVKHHHHHHHHNHIKTVYKKVPVEVKVPVEKIVEKIIEREVPYPVIKRVPYKVEVKTPQPYPVRVVEKEVVHVPRPYPVFKHIPIEVKVPAPYPVEKKVPYPVEVKVPYPVERKIPVPVPVPYRVEVERKVPVPVKIYVPQPYPVEKKVPVPIEVKVKEPYPVVKHVPYPMKVPIVRPEFDKPTHIPHSNTNYGRRFNYPMYLSQSQFPTLADNRDGESGPRYWPDHTGSGHEDANLEAAPSTVFEMRAPFPISFFVPQGPTAPVMQ